MIYSNSKPITKQMRPVKHQHLHTHPANGQQIAIGHVQRHVVQRKSLLIFRYTCSENKQRLQAGRHQWETTVSITYGGFYYRILYDGFYQRILVPNPSPRLSDQSYLSDRSCLYIYISLCGGFYHSTVSRFGGSDSVCTSITRNETYWGYGCELLRIHKQIIRLYS